MGGFSSAALSSSLGLPLLECVQQSHFGSEFAFRHFNLIIEMQIGAQVRRIGILHLKNIWNTPKIEDQKAD